MKKKKLKGRMCECERGEGMKTTIPVQLESFVLVVALKKPYLYVLFFVDFCLLLDFFIMPVVHSLSLPLPSCLLSLWIRGPNCFIAPSSAATHAGVFVLVLKDSTSVHKIV